MFFILRESINLSEKCAAIIFGLKVNMEADCSLEKLVKCYKATYCQKSVSEMKRLYLRMKSTVYYKEGNIKNTKNYPLKAKIKPYYLYSLST